MTAVSAGAGGSESTVRGSVDLLGALLAFLPGGVRVVELAGQDEDFAWLAGQDEDFVWLAGAAPARSGGAPPAPGWSRRSARAAQSAIGGCVLV